LEGLTGPVLMSAWQAKWDSEDTGRFTHSIFPNGTLRIFFRIINDFVHRFFLDRTFVDFTVSLLILPFYIVDFNIKMVKSTVKP
jgi:hypothetical protein